MSTRERGSRATPAAEETGLLGTVIDDLGSRDPFAPENIPDLAPLAETLRGRVLPFVGKHGLLVALIVLGTAGADAAAGVLIASAVVAAALVAAGFTTRRWSPAVGALLPLAVVAAGGLPDGGSPGLVVATLAALAAWLCLRDRLSEEAGIAVVVYGPVVALLHARPVEMRLAVEGITVALLFASFTRRGRARGAFAAAAAGVGIGTAEYSVAGTLLGLESLLALLLALIAVYEWRIRGLAGSSFRRFVNEGLLVMVLWLGAAAFLGANARSAWAWAGLTVAGQAFFAWRDPDSRPTRLAWTAVVLALAVMLGSTSFLSWHQRVAITLALAALLQLAALRLRHSFPSDVAAFLGFAVSVVGIQQALSRPLSPAGLAVGLLATTSLVLFGTREPLPAGPPWWTGFIHDDHLAAMRRLAIGALRPLYASGIGAIVANYLKQGYGWVRYLKGGGDVRLGDLGLVAGHVGGALVLADYLNSATYVVTGDAGLGHLAGAAAWLAWGTALMAGATGASAPLLRLLGLILLAVPVATISRADDLAVSAGLAAASAAAVWAAATLLWRAAPPPAAAGAGGVSTLASPPGSALTPEVGPGA